MRHRAFLSAVLLIAFAACQPQSSTDAPGAESPAIDHATEDDGSPLVIYSGRNKSLVDPLIEQMKTALGVDIEVRYGGTAEMAATLLEEGEATPCDLFIAQDAGALGALADRFVNLPDDVLERVPAAWRDPQGHWVGLSGRARVVVYNTERIEPSALPQSLDDVVDPRYRGRFGVAPANASFQAHMASYRTLRGAEALDQLLAGMVANEPQRYPQNSALVEAVIRGEVDWGLVNHYYLWRALAEQPEAPARNYVMPADDGVSAFVNLAGVGVLDGRPKALEAARYLVSDAAQTYFAEQTFEYPLAGGMSPAVDLEALGPRLDAQVDFAQLSGQFEGTLEAIAASGLL